MPPEHWAYAYRRVGARLVLTSRRHSVRSGEAIRWAAEGAAHHGGGIAFRVQRGNDRQVMVLCRFGDVPHDDAALAAGFRAAGDRPTEGIAACGP